MVSIYQDEQQDLTANIYADKDYFPHSVIFFLVLGLAFSISWFCLKFSLTLMTYQISEKHLLFCLIYNAYECIWLLSIVQC